MNKKGKETKLLASALSLVTATVFAIFLVLIPNNLHNLSNTLNSKQAEYTNNVVNNFKESEGELVLGWNHSFFLTNQGEVFSWGENNHGQLGDGSKEDKHIPTNITNNFKLDDEEQIIKLDSGFGFSIALSNIGEIYTWGYNGYYSLGTGDYTGSLTPRKITDNFDLDDDEQIIQVSSGIHHSATLTDKGNVHSWSNNASGQVGDGTGRNVSSPKKITQHFKLVEGEHITQVNMRGHHSSAVTNKGNVYTWGQNNYGQLADGSKENKLSPTKITDNFKLTGDEKVTSLSLGVYHSSALTNKNNVYTWGHNKYGQSGDGSIENKQIPTKITDNFKLTGDEYIAQLIMGYTHSSALTNEGNVYTWGFNNSGQLGDGSIENKHIPTKITDNFKLTGDEYITQLSMGNGYSSALTNQGNVYTWGGNSHGQLGNNSTNSTKLPDNIGFASSLQDVVTTVTRNSVTINFNVIKNYQKGNVVIKDDNGIEKGSKNGVTGTDFIEIDGLTWNTLFSGWTIEVDGNGTVVINDFKTPQPNTSDDVEESLEINIEGKIKDSDKKITLVYSAKQKFNGTGHHKITYKNEEEQILSPLNNNYSVNNDIKATYFLKQSVKNIEKTETFYEIEGKKILLNSYTGTPDKVFGDSIIKLWSGLFAVVVTGSALILIMTVVLVALLIIYYIVIKNKSKTPPTI